MRRFALFEDSATPQFSPIAQMRPVFELRCGHFSHRERLLQNQDITDWGCWIRSELAETFREEHPNAGVNDFQWMTEGPVSLINGRWLSTPQALQQLEPGVALWIGEVPVAMAVEPADLSPDDATNMPAAFDRVARKKRPVSITGTLLGHPWDLVNENPAWLTYDAGQRVREDGLSTPPPQLAIVGPQDQVFIHSTARIDPFVVLDATHGPVWIDAGARLQAFTRIEGPAYVGAGSQLFRANIREGCSIGPVCRVGGEVEESILHGYVNKYHDGFLGHSYVCPWVNLGALTTNSDLKNDYSAVSVPFGGGKIDTGSTKVGMFVGDHTKTAIGSVFNTGTSIGVMSLILPGGELLPKFIPSFSRVWHGRIEALPDGCEAGLATARAAMSRRNQEVTPAMERLIRSLHGATEVDRQAALDRQQSQGQGKKSGR